MNQLESRYRYPDVDYLEVEEEMLRSGELEPIVHHGVFGEGVEPVIGSLDLVEEDSVVLILQDRLDLLLGGLLLDLSNREIVLARDMSLVLPSMVSIGLAALTLTPVPFPGRMPVLVPSTAPTSTLVPTAYRAMLRTIGTMEFIQRVGRNASMKHGVVPDLLRPLGRL